MVSFKVFNFVLFEIVSLMSDNEFGEIDNDDLLDDPYV